MKLERGMLISPGSVEWYIVVNVRYRDNLKKVVLECLCDYANNVYSFEPNEVEAYVSIDEISDFDYSGYPERTPEHLKRRSIPYHVITEVLLGRQNDRF